MDHIHKALIGPGFGLTSHLIRKPSSCGVCHLRFNSEVGDAVWETHALSVVFCLSRCACFSHTHPYMTVEPQRRPALTHGCLTGFEGLKLSYLITGSNVNSPDI